MHAAPRRPRPVKWSGVVFWWWWIRRRRGNVQEPKAPVERTRTQGCQTCYQGSCDDLVGLIDTFTFVVARVRGGVGTHGHVHHRAGDRVVAVASVSESPGGSHPEAKRRDNGDQTGKGPGPMQRCSPCRSGVDQRRSPTNSSFAVLSIEFPPSGRSTPIDCGHTRVKFMAGAKEAQQRRPCPTISSSAGSDAAV